MAYGALDFSNMFGPKRKKDEEELLGELPPPPPNANDGNPINLEGQPSEYEYTEPTNVPGEPPPGPTDVSTAGTSLPPQPGSDITNPLAEGAGGWAGTGTASGNYGDVPAGTGPQSLPGYDPWTTEGLPQSQPGDQPRPWTYEQTWMDPYIKKDVLGRQGLTGGVSLDPYSAEAATPELGGIPDYQRGLQARDVQSQNLELLQSLASGVPSRAIEMEKERGLQSVQAAASSMRGAPASAVQRAMNQGFAEVNRNAMEAHAKQQLQATQMVNEFATQMRAQDLSLVDIQGQFQQQANLSNAQMANEMRQAEAQINVQLEQQRDAMVNSLVQQGVDRNLALAQISAEMSRLQEELFYKYWAGKLGAMTEIGKELILETGAAETVGHQFAQERDVLALYGAYPTVAGYGVPSTSIGAAGGIPGLGSYWLEPEQQGGWEWDEASGQYVKAGPTGTEYYWDFTTGSWQTRPAGGTRPGGPGPGGAPGGAAGGWQPGFDEPTHPTPESEAADAAEAAAADAQWSAADEAFSDLDAEDEDLVSGAGAKQNIKVLDEFYGEQDPQQFGQMSGAYDFTNPIDQPLGQMQDTYGDWHGRQFGTGKLGEARPGLQPSADADYPQWMKDLPLEPIPGQRFDPNDSLNRLNTAIANAPSGKQWQQDYRGAKEDVAGYVKMGQIGAIGSRLLMGDRDERKRAASSLVGIGVQEAIAGGISGVESFLETSGETKDAINSAVSGIYGSNIRKVGDAVAKALPEEMSGQATQIANELADETANAVSLGADPLSTGSQKLGEAVSETVLGEAGEQAIEEGAAGAAGSMAPWIGGAVQATQAALTGGAPGPTAIRVAGSVGGGLAGASAGGAAGTYVLPGVGTAVGAGLGGLVGSFTGGAASEPLAMAFERNRVRQGRTAAGGIHEPGEFVGAPAVYSGLDTKGYVEGVSTGITPGDPYFHPSTGKFETARDARGVPMYRPSGAGTKSGIDSASDNDLSDFLRTINPVTFDYKPAYGGEKNQYGIIAEDAEQSPVGQTFVKQSGNGAKVIDTGKATMVNMAASANQQRTIDTQGMLIAELLRKMSYLEGGR